MVITIHPFSTDSSERSKIVFYIAILSMILAAIIAMLLKWLSQITGYSIPWWIDIPSVMSIFYILYELFDKRLWKWSLFRTLGLIMIPDLNGKWIGSLSTSYDDYYKEYSVDVTIIQNWAEMCMTLRTSQSESHTLTASILVNRPPEIVLSYNYFSEPKNSATQTMHSHRGTGFLKLVEKDKLKGEYYTGRDRSTQGDLNLMREVGKESGRKPWLWLGRRI